MRTFLLTLAVTDDLIGIAIIAIAYASNLHPAYLGLSLVPMGLFFFIVQVCRRFIRQHKIIATGILSVLAFAAWFCFYNSGIHATISGVALGLLVPVGAHGKGGGLAESMEHKVRPVSAAIAAPVFAFFAAGVKLDGWDGFVSSVTHPIGLGIIIGLPLGKAVGIFGATWLITRFEHSQLDPDIAWIDVFGLAVLGGIGFTVALLVNEISFPTHHEYADIGKIGIIVASLLSAAIASVILGARSHHYKEIEELERYDSDDSGTPDVFERARRQG
jgi:NhaA family Na+:H+ antiporter